MEGVENKTSDTIAISLNQRAPLVSVGVNSKMNDIDDKKELSTLLEDMCLQVEQLDENRNERCELEVDVITREDPGLKETNDQYALFTRRSARNKSKGNAAKCVDNRNDAIVEKQKTTPRKPTKSSTKRRHRIIGEMKFDVGELSYPTSPSSGKKKRSVMEDLVALDPVDEDEEGDQPERSCTFCNHTRHISSLYYCGLCRRVYHSRCVVNRFRDYVDENIDIDLQVSDLINAAEGSDAKILRCNSCKDAFIRFYKSKGYQWKCTCEMCENPVQLIKYRRRILQHLLTQSSGRKIEVQAGVGGLPRLQTPTESKHLKKKIREISEVRKVVPAEPTRKNLRRRSSAPSTNNTIVKKKSLSPVHVSRKSSRSSSRPRPISPPPRVKRLRRGDQNVDEFSSDATAKVPIAVDNESALQEQEITRTRHPRSFRLQGRATKKQDKKFQDYVFTDHKDDVSSEVLRESGIKAALKDYQEGRPVTFFNVPMRFLEAKGYMFEVFSNDCGDSADGEPLKKGVARYSPEKLLSIYCECCGNEMDYDEFTAHSSSFGGSVQVFIKHNHGSIVEWFDLVENFKDYPLPNYDDNDTSDHLTKPSVLEKLKIERYSDQTTKRKSKDDTLYQFKIVCKYSTQLNNLRYKDAIYVFSTERQSVRSVYCPCNICNGKPMSSVDFVRHTIGTDCKGINLRNYIFAEDEQTFLYEIVQELDKKRRHCELESFVESNVK